MSLSVMDKRWIPLEPIALAHGNVFVSILNHHEFIVAGKFSTSIHNENKFDPAIFTFDEWVYGIYGHGAVHAKKKNIIYLFGGYDYGPYEYLFTFWKCEIDKGYKWTKMLINREIKMYYKAYILTPDERYIVIFAGDKLCLFDTNEAKLYDYDVKNEIYPLMHLGLLGRNDEDKLVVSGFIRSVAKQFDMIIPVDIIGIFEKYYNVNMVYLMDGYGNHFYKISLNDVLNVEKKDKQT